MYAQAHGQGQAQAQQAQSHGQAQAQQAQSQTQAQAQASQLAIEIPTGIQTAEPRLVVVFVRNSPAEIQCRLVPLVSQVEVDLLAGLRRCGRQDVYQLRCGCEFVAL